MTLGAGSRLDNYEIVRRIGAGGMGEVWLAKDVRLERLVALKLLPPDLTTDPARVKRFEQEARAASALNHPNVCTIHALGQTEEGRHFIAMEYVDGQTLRDRLTRVSLKRKELIDTAIQIGSALTAAHAAGIVHRDLKPENVMLRPDGLVKVLDFGLAKLVATESDPTMATRTVLQTDPGVAVGTVAYMSPEQARGQHVDARSDIWALGVVLYEMVTGRRPFAGQSTSDVLVAILEHDPAPLAHFDPEVPHELQRIVTKTLRKDPEQRYQVMKDLLLDLQVLRDDLASAERSATSTPPVGSVPSEAAQQASGRTATAQVLRRRWRETAAIVALIAATGVAGWWFQFMHTRAGRASPQTGQASPAPVIEHPLTKLTSGPGLQTHVTWSPDGRFIAYASDRTGNFDIWVQPVEGGDAVQITKAPSQEMQPDWSPDGSTIVYHSDRNGGGIYAVPALGGPERQLSSVGTYPKWSPDGNEVLILVSDFLDFMPGTIHLYAVPTSGGQAVPVIDDFLASGSFWYWVASHPDGRISALGWHKKLGFGFFTLARSGGPPVSSKLPQNFVLRNDAQGLASARFQWNAAGTGVCFELLSNGIRQLWKAVVDPSTLDIVSMERLTTGPSRDTSAAWSRDGARLAYTAETKVLRLWTYPFDSVSGRVTGAGRAITEEDATPCCQDLSVDGRRLVYGLSHEGRPGSEFWHADLVRGTRELVASDAGGWTWVGGAVSHDGSTVAYTRARFGGEHGEAAEAVPMLYSAGGGQQSLGAPLRSALFFPFGWTPDGRELLGSLKPNSGNAVLALWPTTRSDATGPDRILVSEPDASIWEGGISPDGRWVTFVVNHPSRPGHAEIFIAPFSDPSRDRWIRVAADHDWPDKPRWAPDGRTLYFLSRRPGAYFNLWGARFDAGAGKLLGDPFGITNIDSPTLLIAPDMPNTGIAIAERHLVLEMQTTTGNVWMIASVDR